MLNLNKEKGGLHLDLHGSKMENVHLKFIQENYFYSNVNTSES